MIGAAKRKSIYPPGLSALWTILLLVVALCLPETRVWGFAATPQPASGVFAPANPLSIGENYDGWQYDASDSPLAAKRTPQLALPAPKPVPRDPFHHIFPQRADLVPLAISFWTYVSRGFERFVSKVPLKGFS